MRLRYNEIHTNTTFPHTLPHKQQGLCKSCLRAAYVSVWTYVVTTDS